MSASRVLLSREILDGDDVYINNHMPSWITVISRPMILYRAKSRKKKSKPLFLCQFSAYLVERKGNTEIGITWKWERCESTEKRGKNFRPLSDHKSLSNTAINFPIITVLGCPILDQRSSDSKARKSRINGAPAPSWSFLYIILLNISVTIISHAKWFCLYIHQAAI